MHMAFEQKWMMGVLVLARAQTRSRVSQLFTRVPNSNWTSAQFQPEHMKGEGLTYAAL